jgi:hypothetical protein
MFKKGIVFNHGDKLLMVDKMIVDAILLPRPTVSGGMGDGGLNIVYLCENSRDQTGFACARGGGDNKQSAFRHSL